MSNDIDDFLNKIKKLFRFTADNFDLDFFIFPEDNGFYGGDPKGFKVSYHFEEGKEHPKVKIESDIEEQDLNALLNNSLKKHSKGHKNMNNRTENTLNAEEFHLNGFEEQDNDNVKEPYTEINNFDTFTEIIIEIPGIRKENISTDFDKNNRILSFYAEKEGQRFLKDIQIPHDASNDSVSVNINNGLVIIKVLSEINK
ncbi:MAG: Hsp20/alpha crystallin family protein [Promethearchaeota archaeon]